MRYWRILSGILGLLMMTSGCANSRGEFCSTPNGPCNDGACGKGVIVPYKDACQTRKPAGNFLGRIFRWATYYPLCTTTPCDCASGPTCHPPLYSYFTPSQCNRTYQPVDCGPHWWKFWGNKGCGNCKGDRGVCKNSCINDGCGARNAWTITITMPRVSFTKKCNDCNTCQDSGPCNDDKCAGPCMKLPRPIEDETEGKCKRCKGGLKVRRCWSLLGWRPMFLGGCGACGGGMFGLFGDDVGKKCCGDPGRQPTNIDLNHLPILPPDAVKGYNAGCLNKIPTQEPALAPKPPIAEPVIEGTPMPKETPK